MDLTHSRTTSRSSRIHSSQGAIFLMRAKEHDCTSELGQEAAGLEAFSRTCCGEAHAAKQPPLSASTPFSGSLPPQPLSPRTPQFADAEPKPNQMAFPCSSTVRPPRAVRALVPHPRGFRPALTVVAAGNGVRATGAEARASLVLALASQALAASQRRAVDLVTEAAKYASPSSRFEPRTLEEALMSVPDLETVPFRVLKREVEYEIRQVESYYVAETTMPGRTGFDFSGSSQSFNVLASYLFGKNTRSEQMEMTTPVFTRKGETGGEKMDMTTPVITKKSADEDKWKMSFVMPSKYGPDLPQAKDPSVTIKEVPSKIIAVVAFPGLVTDDDISQRESRLREALQRDTQYRVKEDSVVEVAQYNPPFTLPFTRRNEVALEVEQLGGTS